VTFWRRLGNANQPTIGVWAVPVLGGAPRPYLEDVAEYDWSDDGARLVYHTADAGDPMFVRDRTREPRRLFAAPAGLHAHFPIWSRDQAFIYFVQGVVPDRMDIWRITSSGGAPEQITRRGSHVSHPVFLDARTLVYLATEPDGSGPFLYHVDVQERTARRASFGIERYTSLSASSDAGRLVATVSGQKSALWRLPATDVKADVSAMRRVALTTGTGSAPRFGPDFLLYVSTSGGADSIWKFVGDVATELWKAPHSRVIGPPAIAPDGRRIAFVAERNRQPSLYSLDVDGTNLRVLTSSLKLEGAPAWARDGQSVTVGAVLDGGPALVSLPLDGGPPKTIVREHGLNPVWSTDGRILAYTGADVGTAFPLKAVMADGRPVSLPHVMLSRGSRHLTFIPGTRSLVVLRGELEHKDLWSIDLATGEERQLTNFPPEFIVRDFDLSWDGRELVIEQVEEHSAVVLIEPSLGRSD
jgi:Tol biopolymer transport system component